MSPELNKREIKEKETATYYQKMTTYHRIEKKGEEEEKERSAKKGKERMYGMIFLLQLIQIWKKNEKYKKIYCTII